MNCWRRDILFWTFHGILKCPPCLRTCVHHVSGLYKDGRTPRRKREDGLMARSPRPGNLPFLNAVSGNRLGQGRNPGGQSVPRPEPGNKGAEPVIRKPRAFPLSPAARKPTGATVLSERTLSRSFGPPKQERCSQRRGPALSSSRHKGKGDFRPVAPPDRPPEISPLTKTNYTVVQE